MGRLTLANAKEMILIDKNSLDEELVKQASTFDDIADKVAELRSLRDEKKEELGRVKAERFTFYKDSAEKVTDKSAEASVLTDKSYKEIEIEYRDLCLEFEEWQNKKESFLQRASMLKELCGLFISGYWQQSSVRGNADTDKTSYKITRERLAKDRSRA